MTSLGGGGKRALFAKQTQASKNVSAIMSSSKDVVKNSEMIPLSKIVRDPNNHRHIPVDWDNPGTEILDSVPHAQEKRDFLEKLWGLAKSIQSAGLINPCVVYRRGEFYHLSSGQRRLLAHRLLEEQAVFCVIDRDPKVRLQQWVENHQREAPSLADNLQGILHMLDEENIEISSKEAVLGFLKETAGMGRSNAYLWSAVLAGPHLVRMAIFNGTIVALRDAAKVASFEGAELDAALEQLATMGEVSGVAGEGGEPSDAADGNAGTNSESGDGSVPPPPANSPRANGKRVFRPVRNVVIKTANTAVSRMIVERVMGAEFVNGVDFNDVKQVNELMKRMVENLGKQLNEAS